MSTSNATYIPLESQVGGHPGISTTEDGSLLIKPALANEIRFYQLISSEAILAPLRPFVPKFFGTLRLQGSIEAAALDAPQDAINQITQEGFEEEKDK
jgi:inositol-polyphosphate multikinase